MKASIRCDRRSKNYYIMIARRYDETDEDLLKLQRKVYEGLREFFPKKKFVARRDLGRVIYELGFGYDNSDSLCSLIEFADVYDLEFWTEDMMWKDTNN